MRALTESGRRVAVTALTTVLGAGLVSSASPRPPLDARDPLVLLADESTGPVLFWLSALADSLHIPSAVRTIASIVTIVVATLTTGLLVRRPVAGGVAAMTAFGILLVFSGLDRDLQAATAAATFHVLATGLLARAFDATPQSERLLLGGAGCCAGVALLCRSSTWFVSLPMFFWLLIHRSALDHEAVRRSRPLSSFLWGYAPPLLLVSGVYLAAGDGSSYLQWLLHLRWEQAPIALLGFKGWLLAYPSLWLLGYAIVIPSAFGWLREVEKGTLRDVGRAWLANGLEIAFGLGALSWLAISPFPAEDFGVAAAIGGPWIGFCTGFRIEAFIAEARLGRKQSGISGATELAHEPAIQTG